MSEAALGDARAKSAPKPSRPGRGRLDRGRLLRWMRDWHGYLSALTFMALILFSATGLALNHPEWFKGFTPRSRTMTIALPPEARRTIADSDDPIAQAADIVRARFPVRGAFSSGDHFDQEVLLRFESPRGSTDAAINLASGRAEISIRDAYPIAMINDLHRGKNAGAAWRAAIDLVAALTLTMSILGYGLFLIMRTRIALALILTAAGFGGLVLTAVAFVQ